MPNETDRASLLARSWTHSHEEDAGGRQVFRPADHNFPRARGRVTYHLAPDGTLRWIGPGPDDRRREVRGTWRLQGQRLVLNPDTGSPIEFDVENLESDRLILRPVASP